MTLTALMPSLRRTLPDPIEIDRWPEFTTVSPTDVTIAGVSLVRLVDWCSTPCVHTAAAVIPGTHGRPSDSAVTSVVITRVLAVSRPAQSDLVVLVDAELCGCRIIASEMRLIGRASTAHRADAVITSGSLDAEIASSVPADIRVGDLLVVPCVGATCLREVRQPAAGRADDNDRHPEHVLSHCSR